MVYVEPENGGAFRFVVGVRRKWFFWKKVVYSYLPVCARVNDHKELEDLDRLASEETERLVVTKKEDDFREENDVHLFFGIRETSDDIEHPSWYTGRWFRNDGRTNAVQNKLPEVVSDIRDCQLFVRETYAIAALSGLNRAGFHGIIERVYVNVKNIFRDPCIVTICVNKKIGTTRYLKRYKEGDHRLYYTDSVGDAMLIFPEEVERTYDYLASNHKELSFTMVAKPDGDIPAKDLKAREKELKQCIACDFFIRRNEKEKD